MKKCKEKTALLAKNEILVDDNEILTSNCDEYNGIVTKLNGQIVNALNKPLSDLEQIVFEIEESSKNPKEIAEWLKEPISELRNNFACIKLNNENLTELPGIFTISIDALGEYDSWADRVPVKFDESKHSCDLESTEYVLLRTRGFKYVDNLSGVRVEKAKVIPYKGNNDKKPTEKATKNGKKVGEVNG